MTHTNKGVGGLKETIAIVDYGAGNLQSVKKALDFIGAPSVITKDAEAIRSADAVILPGRWFICRCDGFHAGQRPDGHGDRSGCRAASLFWAFVWGFSFCLRLLKSPRSGRAWRITGQNFYAFHKRMV